MRENDEVVAEDSSHLLCFKKISSHGGPLLVGGSCLLRRRCIVDAVSTFFTSFPLREGGRDTRGRESETEIVTETARERKAKRERERTSERDNRFVTIGFVVVGHELAQVVCDAGMGHECVNTRKGTNSFPRCFGAPPISPTSACSWMRCPILQAGRQGPGKDQRGEQVLRPPQSSNLLLSITTPGPNTRARGGGG